MIASYCDFDENKIERSKIGKSVSVHLDKLSLIIGALLRNQNWVPNITNIPSYYI